MSWQEAYSLRFSGFGPQQRRFLLGGAPLQRVTYWRSADEVADNPRAQMLQTDWANYLPEYILRKGDLCTMAHGLELRLYPTSAPASTVGGWLAQGGAGIGSHAYGWFSENVHGARVVTATGEIHHVSGGDLAAIADAEGTIAPEGGCPGNFYTSRKWTFEQGALVIRDHNGQPLGQLGLGAPGRFDGKAANGQPVTLTR